MGISVRPQSISVEDYNNHIKLSLLTQSQCYMYVILMKMKFQINLQNLLAD